MPRGARMKPTSRAAAIRKAFTGNNRGVLPAEAVARLAGSPANIGKLMMELLPLAEEFAVTPLSGYPVGAVAAGLPKGDGGWCNLYLGANLELRNAALNFTTHAEQAAVNNAWLNGEPGIQMLAVSAAPCGYCRQFLYELTTARRLLILIPKRKGSLIYQFRAAHHLSSPRVRTEGAEGHRRPDGSRKLPAKTHAQQTFAQ